MKSVGPRYAIILDYLDRTLGNHDDDIGQECLQPCSSGPVLSDGVVRGFVLGTNEVDGGVTGFHDLLADNRFLS